jgi:hypothetical protein
MVIGVALIGVIGVALVDAFIAVIITTKEIMRASPRHSRQAFQADRQCGDVGKRRALAALRRTRAPSHRRREASPFLDKQDAAEKIGLHVEPIEAVYVARRTDAEKMHSVHAVGLTIA